MARRGQKGRRSAPPRRARRSLLSFRPTLHIPRLELEPHHLDIIALALIAIGLFLAGVAYLHWAGGALGNGAITAVRFVYGLLGYTVPAALVVGGALVLVRELRPAGRPLRAGLLCLTGAITLMLAAGTLGIGPGRAANGVFWRPATVEARGGIIGQAELWVTSHLLSMLGAHLLALFMLLAGLILVSGATVAGIVRATRESVANSSRALKRSGIGRSHAPTEVIAEDDLLPPESDTSELVIRPTHVEAPPIHELGQEEPEAPQIEPTAEADSGPEAPERGQTELDLTPQGRYRSSITEDPGFRWQVPSFRFLTRSTAKEAKPDTAGQEQVASALLQALQEFNIKAEVVGRVTGPHITRYELRLAPGTKVSSVAKLKDDIAYALAATDVRVLAPIPGKQAVGVEVPNATRRIVHLGDVLQEPPPDSSPVFVWLGKDIAGKAIGTDLVKMPHLLVAGTTGAGKSACINAMLSSILLRANPHEVRVVLVDPKQVELNHYEVIPPLLPPVITTPRMAANALHNLVKEMEQRYGTMSLARTRGLPELNRARERRGEPPLPYIVCVVDELADLMMVAPVEVEDSITRLAQKARAVGIHLVLATQSPRVQVITGLIKANVPSRIAFAVSSQQDSRVILDQNGAESLIGMGDMLFSPAGSSKLQRIQGAYIDEEQIAALTESWRRQGAPEFHEELLEEVEQEEGEGGEDSEFPPDEDPLLEEAISLVAQMGTASTSMLQRRLRLGYTRAGRLIDMLERRGVISGYEGSKPRQVLISEADLPRILAALSDGQPATAAASARDGE